MSAETLTQPAEPLLELNHLGTGIDRINRLVLPINEPVLRGAQYGEINSRVRGQGGERDGVRDYEIGDDPRYIDWNITARSADGVPKLRQHMKDITPDLWLATDAPQSRNEITPGAAYMEQELALSSIMAMLLLAEKEGLPSGVLAVNNTERFQATNAELGQEHVVHAGRKLVDLSQNNPENGGERQYISDLMKRLGSLASESLVVVVSDFRDFNPNDEQNGWRKPLQQLKHQGNDIIAIEPTNPADFLLEVYQRPEVNGGKTTWLDIGKERRKINERYTEVANDQQAAIDETIKSVGATHIKLSTEDVNWFTSLRKQLHLASRA